MTLCGFEIAPGEKRQVKLPGSRRCTAGSVAAVRGAPRKDAGGHSWGAWL